MEHDIYLEILQHNRGFDNPENWVSYAQNHHFRLVDAAPVNACPDCGSQSSLRIGQYVYYSTLIHLQQCRKCGLAYSDSIIDPQVTRSHWATAYKDEDYFTHSRRAIFGVIADLIDQHVPAGGSVLDIGGAKGHLMEIVRNRRPDLRLAVNDICEISCASARERGFEAMCCPLKDLQPQPTVCNCLVMLDVIYYEPDVRETWKALQRMLTPGGIILIRIPNKLWMIRTAQICRKLITTQSAREHNTRIPFFNPEYILAFSQTYLRNRLRGCGFKDIQFLPSPMPLHQRTGILNRIAYATAFAMHKLTTGRLVISPSQIVFARMGEK